MTARTHTTARTVRPTAHAAATRATRERRGRGPATVRLATAWITACGTAACAAGEGPATFDLDGLPPLTLTEELRIGSLDDPDVGFTTIGQIRLTPGDTLYVAEWSATEIRVYAPDGSLVRRIGRRGEGPGEVQSVTNWGLHGDTVWVIDDVRATFFRRDGSLISTVPVRQAILQYPPQFGVLQAVTVGPDGRLMGDVTQMSPPRDPSAPAVRLDLPRVVYGPDGEVADTVGYRTVTLEPDRTPTIQIGRVSIRETQLPSSTELRRIAGEDTVRVLRPTAASADEGVLTVLRIGPRGDTAVHSRLRYRPVPVPASFRDSVIEAQVATYLPYAGPEGALRSALSELYSFAPFHPPVSSVNVLTDGSIWLRRAPEESDSGRWIVLAPDGTPQAEAVTPPGTTLVASERGALYAVERDAFGVPWLVRYRLEPGVRP